jgi:two-component system OmpR family sensor kinase
MRQAVALLDRFIKDTTHELNTPVATILSNIETINQTNLDEKTAKKLQRIDIASRTISTLYDDLTYLVLNHNIPTKDETLNLSEILKERLHYFDLAIKQKKLQLHVNIDSSVTFFADRTKIERLFDNLISNAIKYNNIKGELSILLKKGQCIIENSGRGIAKEKLPTIFNRYIRADNVAGGFGIGLHIVSKIAQLYHIELSIESEEHQSTRIILSW